MADFTGFEKEMFDFFFNHESEETKLWVKNTIKDFANEISLFLNKLDPFYSDYRVGNLRLKDMQNDEEENHCWAAFGPKDTYTQFAHQTININAQGIEIFVNVELKNAIERLRKKLLEEEQTFKDLITNLHLEESFCVQLQERKQEYVRKYSYHQIVRFEENYLKNNELGKYGFDYLFIILKEIPLPYFTLRTRISRVSILQMKNQKKELVDKVTFIMKELHPLVKYINES